MNRIRNSIVRDSIAFAFGCGGNKGPLVEQGLEAGSGSIQNEIQAPIPDKEKVEKMDTITVKAFLLVLVILLAGCASTNTVSSVDPAADFSQYKTFEFAKVPDTDGKEYQSLETRYLRTAVTRELKSRGFSQSDQADLVINFSIETEEKIRSRSVPSASYGVGYDPYDDVYYDDWGMNHQTRIDQYTEGKLNIDVIDRQARQAIWQGSTKGRLTKQDYENAEATLSAAVTDIFTQFPVAAPSTE